MAEPKKAAKLEFDRIGKYKIQAKIGQGAMGEVFRAHDPILNRHVAIKTIASALDAEDSIRQRFIREAQAAARLNHPNIVTVHDSGEEAGKIFMAMELLEGNDLKEIIVSRSRPRLDDKLQIMEQMAEGLAFAHANGIVHRDLKPSNIHVQPNGQVKIMDFGLARFNTSEMTKTGTVMGTPNYMSPEQVRGEKADIRSDIFSSGVVFYELIAGKKPFDADTMHGVLFAVLDNEPEPLPNLVQGLPAILWEVIEKCLQKDPADRFQDAAQLRDALSAVRNVVAEGRGGEATLESELGITDSRQAESGVADATIDVSGATIVPTRGRRTMQRSRTGSTGRTGSGSSSQGRRGSQESTPPPPPSRTPIYAIGGAVVLLLGAGVGFLALRQPAPPTPAPQQGAQVNALTQALVGTQLELASKNLADKDYRGAVEQAEKALQLDPENARARQVRDSARTTLANLEKAATEARGAFEAGDIPKASAALTQVLSIDPTHPVAADLSKRLNKHFKGQADEARTAMAKSRQDASKANADVLPQFVEAAGLAKEADALVGKGEFVEAASKFLQARDGFDKAARTAQKQAAARVVPTPPPATPTSVAAATLPPATLPPVTQAPVATLPPTTLPPPTTLSAAALEEPAVRKVIGDYGRAIEQKDIAAFKTVKPGLSKDEEKALLEAFKYVKTQQVNLTIESIEVKGDRATARVTRKDTINGKAVQAVQQTIMLAKATGGWKIDSIGR